MTGPKHLWSGNWEEESADLPRPVGPSDPEPAPPTRRPRRLRNTLPPWLAVLIVVGVALAALGPRSARNHHAASAPSSASLVPQPFSPTPTITSPTPTPPVNGLSGRTVNWLGMQISTVQSVGAVVQTVRLGSPADAGGLDPGDVILTINGHAITSAGQIGAAVLGLRQGQLTQVSVARGSTTFTAVVAVSGHPTTSP